MARSSTSTQQATAPASSSIRVPDMLRRSWVRRFSVLCLGILAIEQPTQAGTNETTVALAFQTEPSQQPDHLCVVTGTGHPKALKLLKDGVAGPPDASLTLSQLEPVRHTGTNFP